MSSSNAEAPQLQIEYVGTKSLLPYANNAKIHEKEQVEQIASSIKQFEMCDPIAVWTNGNGELEIVEGHGRLLALESLGIDVAPIIKLDHLTDEERRAYTHIHNQTTLVSGFDQDILNIDLEELDFDWEEFGFDVFDDEEKSVTVTEDEPPEYAEKRCASGDIWQLGEHRLICGDSTNSLIVSKLMGDERADICFTSPPYNMGAGKNYGGGWNLAPNEAMSGGIAYNEFDDNLSDEQYAQLLIDSLNNALSYCDDVMFNVGLLRCSKFGIVSMLSSHADKFFEVLVWNKSQSMPHGMKSQRGWVSHRCELVFCFNQSGKRNFSHPQWKPGEMINRIDTANASGNKYANEHSATFPVDFAAKIIENFTDDSVLDLFGGTGTTMIAAEQLGRKCYMVELDPHYCDIILKRWEDFTGGKAVKIA